MLLATHNGMRWLPRQLDTLLQQEAIAVKILTSDDASSDGTRDWLQQQAERDSRIQLLPAARHGSACRNFYYLIEHAASQLAGVDYIALADQDDVWLPGKCRHAIECLQKETADAYSSDATAFWADGRRKDIIKSQPQTRGDYLMEAPGPGCTFVMTPRALQLVAGALRHNDGGIAAVGYHDWLIYALVRGHGLKWVIDKCANVEYRQHDTNHHGANVGWVAFRRRFAQLISGHWFQQAGLIAAFLSESDAEARRLFEDLRNSRAGCLRIALCMHRYRRAPLDRLVLALASLILAVKGFRLEMFNRRSKHH